jgi:PmbA protein
VLIKEGVLKDYLYDLRTSSKEGKESNGHGFRASLGAQPQPHPTNFYLKPGTETEEALLNSHPKVFYLWDVMGLHMADPITGDFSFGASGLMFERGQLTQAVRGVTIAGRLIEVLKNVVAVGKELVWYEARGTPNFLVSKLTVAGT